MVLVIVRNDLWVRTYPESEREKAEHDCKIISEAYPQYKFEVREMTEESADTLELKTLDWLSDAEAE